MHLSYGKHPESNYNMSCLSNNMLIPLTYMISDVLSVIVYLNIAKHPGKAKCVSSEFRI